MINKFKIIIFFFFLIFADGSLIAQNSANIKRHLNYLGSDLFEGRGTGTIGGELTAKYLALHLTKYQLTPMGYANTFYQYIPMHGSKPNNNSKIIIINKGKDTLQIKEDFQFYHSGGRIFAPNPIAMAFVGFGISAPEFEYDDYDNINVEGKVVIFVEGEPTSDNSNYFNGEFPTKYSFADTKQKIALSKGAVGTILLPAYTCKSNNDWGKIIKEFYFEDISLAYLPTPLLSIILNPKQAPLLFKKSKYSFDAVKDMYETQSFKSFDLVGKLLFESEFKRRDFVAPNVIGFLEGSSEKLKNEYIVVTAHYDHLGIGLPVKSDSVYNGVLDNAIGVAALLELAKMFSENNILLKRSVIFLFLTGEEKGLLGSSYFAEHLPVPKESVIANLNIDGLAVFGNFNSIIGIGAELSSLNKTLNIVAKNNHLKIEKIPEQFNAFESFLHSDQLAFARAGIPSILISDGLVYENISRREVIELWKDYIHNRYHTPFDDLSQTIDFSASIKHIKVLSDFIRELANTNLEIKWNKQSPFQRVKK